MSYNITSVEIVHSDRFCISRALLEELRGDIDCPEVSILDRQWVRHWATETDGVIHDIQVFWWSGEWSGHTIGELKRVLSEFEGDVDLVLTWEGGDRFTGLRLRNHVVTEHRVVMSLGDEVKT